MMKPKSYLKKTKMAHKCKIVKGQIIPANPVRFKSDLSRFEDKFVEIKIEKIKKTRTSQQNRALWLYFTILAYELNQRGLDMKTIIREEVEIEWTKDSICQYLWRPLQKTMFGEISTRKLTTEQINQIYDNLNRIIIERTSGEVQVNFPSIEELFVKNLDN